MSIGISIPKFNDTTPNEDSFLASDNFIAISECALGCGLYSDEWSKYLINNLSLDIPIKTFCELDAWIDKIWEPFYIEHEQKAQQGDGLLQSKFYNEGSCATLVAGWKACSNELLWCSYGDSVIFHYDKSTKKLEHSFTKLADFSNSPMLISCKENLEESGFRSGVFHINSDSIVFAASDALSHYIMMMYMLANKDFYSIEIEETLSTRTSNSNLLQAAECLNYDFEKDVINELAELTANPLFFMERMKELHNLGVLDIDDYTIAFLTE